jgi:tRNA-Thr(GGU) m(6)t(6)A37 methyltransferase TsaA
MAPELRIIGSIETPYRNLDQCPRNVDLHGPECRLRLTADYVDGLLGLEAGQTILILYWLGAGDRHRLRQHSRRTGEYAGVFALRSPHRPNPIGAALLPIVRLEEDVVVVRGLDCLDGTELLDIKPAILAEGNAVVI